MYSPTYVITISFLVILIQIIDVNGNSPLVENFVDGISLNLVHFYFVMLLLSLFFQLYFLTINSKIVFTNKKASSNSGLIISYIYLASHITIIIFLVFLLGEQWITSTYRIPLIQLIAGFSLIISAFIMILLGIKSVKSFITTRSKITGVYAFAIIAISSQLFIAFLYVEVNLYTEYTEHEFVTPKKEPLATYVDTYISSLLSSFYTASKSLSFVSLWIASLLLTRSYVSKIGKAKYSLILGAPVAYFLLQVLPPLLNQTIAWEFLLKSIGPMFPTLYNFMLNTVNVGAGVLLGISFIMLSKSLNDDYLRFYLIISGVGIMMIYGSNVSIILILAAYPPWGIITVSFALSTSFLLLLGVDSATLYVARDARVRSFLSESKDRFELLKAFGSAKASKEAELKIHRAINRIRSHMESDSLFTSTTEMEDIKEYIGQVLAELKKGPTAYNKTRSQNETD